MLKRLLTVLVLSFNANADYLDIGHSNNSLSVLSKVHVNGFIIDLERSNDDKLGFGLGFQQQGVVVYAGLG